MRAAWLIILASLLFTVGCDRPASQARPEAAGSPASSSLAFTDVTQTAGLEAFRHVNGAAGEKWFPETMGAGGGFLDYDGDGHLDLALVGGGAWEADADRQVRKLWLYRNQGDGTFADVTTEALPPRLGGYGFGVAAADYDNDGDDDLFFTTLGPNHLLRNDAGVFADVTTEAGLSDDEAWSTSALFFDADRDGDLDLYVGHYVVWSPEKDLWCSSDGETKGYCTPELYEGAPGRFYRNRGDGTFADETQAAGFGVSTGKTLGLAAFDFNRDGWPDLVVANDTEPDLLFQNDGDGTFTEVGVLSGIAFDERGRARAGMGLDVGVVDETGEETIFVGNFSNEMIGVYRHLSGGVFLDRAATSQIGRPSLLTLTFGLFLFDVDLDGDLDLFTANGHVQPHIERVKDNVKFRQPPHLFLNAGDGTFTDAAPTLGGALSEALVGRGAAYADYDDDGDLDILVTENNGPAHLWRNDLSGANYLRVAVAGRQSNWSGLGTRVVAFVAGQRQERRIRTGSSFLSQSEKVATFGLGRATQVDSLFIFWPSGQVDRLAGLAANQTLRLVEEPGGKPAP